MSSLGSFFPDDMRRKLANENLKIGSILRLMVTDTVPPKIKRLIVVGMDTEKVMLATVFINTEINPYIFNSKELQELQLPLESQEHDFLDHDSFVDCSKIQERKLAIILEAMTQDPSIHLGLLPDVNLKTIRVAISKSKTIAIRIKKKYGLFLV